GLTIQHFSGNGVSISDTTLLAQGAQGVAVSGTVIQDNGQAGVLLTSSNNLVGPSGASAGGNTIQRNQAGILITGPGGTGNRVEANTIQSNRGQGVLVTTSNNTIGSLVLDTNGVPAQGNLIADNDQGIVFTIVGAQPDAFSEGNEALGNRIT